MGRGLLRRIAAAVDWIVPKRRKRVLLYSIPGFDDTVRSLVAALGDKHQVTVIVPRMNDRAVTTARELQVNVLGRGERRALWAFMRSGTVFMTHELFPFGPGRRTVVNVWHGELTKPVGVWGHERPAPCNYAVTSSQLGAAYRAAEFSLSPHRVLVTGLPRNDAMFCADEGSVRRRAGLREDHRLVVWLPTWRHSTSSKESARVSPDLRETLDELDPWLEATGTVLVVKAHPLARLVSGEVRDTWVSVDDGWLDERGLTLYELLGASDGLITDASSVWIDYLLMDKPTWIHFPDLDSWERGRSLLLEPYGAWVPGQVTRTPGELRQALAAYLTDGLDVSEAQRQFLRTVLHRHHDGSAAARLVHELTQRGALGS